MMPEGTKHTSRFSRIPNMLDSRLNILLILVVITMGGFTAETIFSQLSGNLALAANSMHTLLDATLLIVAIIAARIAARPASASHTYGYGKIEPLGCLLSGIAMIVLSVLFMHASADMLLNPDWHERQSITEILHHDVDVLLHAIFHFETSTSLMESESELEIESKSDASCVEMCSDITTELESDASCVAICSAVAAEEPDSDTSPRSMAGIWGGVGALFAEILKTLVLRKAIKGFGGVAFKADQRHVYVDMVASCVTIAVFPLLFYGIYWVDYTATLALGGLLCFISAKISHRAAQELLDVTSPKMVDDVKGIIESVPDVIKSGTVMLRRSGDTLFADASAIVRGDTSVEEAHRISEEIEEKVKKHVMHVPTEEEHSHGLAEKIENVNMAIHVEPDWTDVPIDSRLIEVAKGIDDVIDASHASTHNIGDKIYADLHVTVDGDMSLASTYEISNKIEAAIKSELPGIERTTIRLAPSQDIELHAIQKDEEVDMLIREILSKHDEILGTIKIMSLKFGNVYKIDIDCMLDGEYTIEQIHQVLTDIEHDIIKEVKNAIVTIHPVPI